MGEVRIDIQSESALSRHPAVALVYEDNRLVSRIEGYVVMKPGADGKMYHCVELRVAEIQ